MKTHVILNPYLAVIFMLFIFQLNVSDAQEILIESKNTATSQCNQQLVKVNGLVCDFCAQALEKVFNKQQAVNHIDVDLDQGLIAIDFNENQTIGQDTLTQLITDSGYNVVEFKPGCNNE